jgi:hypothetical protein
MRAMRSPVRLLIGFPGCQLNDRRANWVKCPSRVTNNAGGASACQQLLLSDRKYPGRGSNPDWNDFKSFASTDWATGAYASKTTRAVALQTLRTPHAALKQQRATRCHDRERD